jgi:type I restriction enzyme M protein
MAGQFGQFRTPRQIVDLMVAIGDPREGELILDPACGSGGFLVSASDFSKKKGVAIKVRGIEIDRTVARIAESNITFHNVLDGEVTNSDGLKDEGVKANLVLANPPFSGSVSNEIAKEFEIKTMKTEILFLEAISRQLAPDGRAVVVVPLSLLTGDGASRKARKVLLQGGHLRAVIELPIGVFRPYTDIRSAILFWDLSSSSDQVLMTKVLNDGFSLDQKRRPVPGTDLPEVLKLLNNEPSSLNYSIVKLEHLEENGINLNPSRYLTESEKCLKAIEEPEAILDKVASHLQSLVSLVDKIRKDIG